MVTKLTLGEKLSDLRKEHGIKSTEELSEKLNGKISKSALNKYENIDSYDKDISMVNLIILAEFYHVSVDYLLGLTEQRDKTDLQIEDLHISDPAILVLENDVVNNRLISEIIAHPGFINFILDSEIYVDQVAAQDFAYGNVIVDFARKRLIDEKGYINNLTMRTLELTRMDEGEFVLKRIHDDIDEILREIRKKHENDTDSSDVEKEVKNMLNTMNEISNIIKNDGPHSSEEIISVSYYISVDVNDTSALIFYNKGITA